MSDTPDNDYLNSHTVVNIVLVELSLATTLIIAVLATILFSSTVHRSALSTNLFICLLIFCLSYFILPILGEWNTSEPSFGPCIASAMATYASFPIGTAAILSLSISVFFTVFQLYARFNRVVVDFCLLIFPYIAWIGVMIQTYVIASNHRDELVRHGYPNCFLLSAAIRTTGRALIAVFSLPCFVLQCFIIYRLYSVSSPFRHNPELHRQMREPIMRMSIFCLGSIFGIGVALSMGKHWNKASQMIFLKLFPLAAVLTLGTRREILRSWLRWIKSLSCKSERKKESHVQLRELNKADA